MSVLRKPGVDYEHRSLSLLLPSRSGPETSPASGSVAHRDGWIIHKWRRTWVDDGKFVAPHLVCGVGLQGWW
jgi:hypothetical protein